MNEFPKTSDDSNVVKFAAEVATRQANIARLETERDNARQSPGDDSVSAAAKQRRAGGVATTVTRSVADIDHDLKVEREALQLARQDLAKAESEASRLIAESLKPSYAALVKRGAKAVEALKQYAVAERDFRDGMRSADVRFTAVFPAMLPPGRLDEDDLNRWLAEARESFAI